MDTFWQEIRWGARILARSPGFTAIAIFTLALGIGATITIFSLIDAVILNAVPVREPGQLLVFKWHAHDFPNTRRDMMSIDCGSDSARAEGCSFSLPMFEQFNSLTNVFSEVVALSGSTPLALTGNGPANVTRARFVSGGFFRTAGVAAALGRTLGSPDDKNAAEPVAILSYVYWESAFGRDSSVLNKAIYLNGMPVTIVGVTAREFVGLDASSVTDMWLPLKMRPQLMRDSSTSPGVGDDIWWLAVTARLKPGISPVQAEAAAADLFRNRVLNGPKPLLKEEDEPGIVLLPAQVALSGALKRFSKPLMILMIAVIGLLFIACANVAGLMVARAMAREREMAVQAALGASSARIIRQLFIESALISLAGGALGVLLALWGTPILALFLSKGGLWPADFDMRPGARVFIFAAGVSILVGILCALAPAIRDTRLNLATALKGGSHNIARVFQRPGHPLTLGNLLVVAQVAIATVTLIGAGLLVRTLANLKSTNPGFDANRVLLFGVDPILAGYKGARVSSLYRELLDRLGSLPGVVSVSYSRETLLGGNLIGREVYIEGSGQDSGVEINVLPVGPNFFETMRIPLLAGRAFTQADIDSSTKPIAVIVNETFANRYLRNQNPIGRRFGTGRGTADFEIVGVVSDAKYKGLREEIRPSVFMPLKEGRVYFELRSTGDPTALISSVRSAVSELDSNLPLFDVKTESEQIDRALFLERLVALMSGLFGLLALVVVCLGLYGLLSFQVTRRTREIGIRIALGATKIQILRLVVGHGIKLTAVGVVIGIAAAFGITRYLQSLLYGVHPTDPLTFTGVAVLLLVVAIIACHVPAQRASSVNPVKALRYE